ncbi:TIGR03790 family protein [Bacteroidota bacterium]
MKNKLCLIFYCIIILSATWSESSAQIPFTGDFIPPPQLEKTYANIATAENVLVVYRLPRDEPTNPDDSISAWVKNYYKAARNIPDENIVGLVLPHWKWYENQNELVKLLAYNDELIHLNTWQNSPPPNSKDYAWQYVQEYIMDPIQYHLDNTFVNGVPLKEKIRYIVLCKGIPLKVNSWVESGSIAQILLGYGKLMVSVDALVCLLSQPDPTFSILTDVHKKSMSSQVNPYYNQDPTYSMDYRFVANHFIAPNGVQLSYLVSRLDGESYDDVVDLIDRSLIPDKSGNSVYVLDATQNGGPGTSTMRNDAIFTDSKLRSLGMNDTLNTTNDHVIAYPFGNVIAYTSSGKHAGLPLGYPVNTLNFNYSNGAIFNTYESFNGTTMDVDNFSVWGKDNQGLISEFIHSGGTGGAGHVYEPTTLTVSKDYIYFTEYSIGYSAVDAAYLGMPIMAFQNVVVGDPLVTIAWGKQTLTANKIWDGRNLVTGEVTIPLNKTLTINDDSYIELRHKGFITGDGQLFIGQDVTFDVYSWQKALFLSYDVEDHPRLVWGEHPTFPAINYNVYRSINDGPWVIIAHTTQLQYIDSEVGLHPPGLQERQIADYYITGLSQRLESDPSNIVRANVTPNRGFKASGDQNKNNIAIEYSLNQNYPNPFNPTTNISYSLENAGLITLKVYDILGKEVATLVNENQEVGNYSVEFNASQLPSGIYFYKITSANYTATRKLILLK